MSLDKLFSSYKTYDPNSEGYGNPKEWKGGFYARMGREEAEKVIHNQKRTPREILGVALSATKGEIKSAYRKLVMQWHPDLNKSEDAPERGSLRSFRIIRT
jgi:hypothetical protein